MPVRHNCHSKQKAAPVNGSVRYSLLGFLREITGQHLSITGIIWETGSVGSSLQLLISHVVSCKVSHYSGNSHKL